VADALYTFKTLTMRLTAWQALMARSSTGEPSTGSTAAKDNAKRGRYLMIAIKIGVRGSASLFEFCTEARARGLVELPGGETGTRWQLCIRCSDLDIESF